MYRENMFTTMKPASYRTLELILFPHKKFWMLSWRAGSKTEIIYIWVMMTESYFTAGRECQLTALIPTPPVCCMWGVCSVQGLDA